MDIAELAEIYAEYDRAYEKAVAAAPVTGGLLGMGDSPKNAACHEIFYERAGAWAEGFAAADPSPEAAAQALELILKAADLRRGQGTYWYCYAAQGYGEALTDRVDPAAAAALLDWYEGAYPAIDRLPVQKRLVKALKARARAGARRPLLGRRP